MTDLLDTVRGVVERGKHGEDVEGYAVHQREFHVKAYGGDIESLSSAEPRGASARVVAGKRVGFAYTTDLTGEGIDELVQRARDNARHGSADDAIALPASSGRYDDVPRLFDVSQTRVAPDEKVAFALELEAMARSADDRIRTVEEAVYSDAESEVAIATSTGIEGHFRRTDAWCYVLVIATDDDDTETGFEFDLARGMSGLDRSVVAATAADRAVGVLGARKIPSERMAVVFDPYTMGQFLGVLGAALTGEAVQKGRSLFADRLGEQVASPFVQLIDDGRAAGAPGAAPWDGEGVPTGSTAVIQDGVLRCFLYDTITARRVGRSSTGNAARAGFKSAPHPAPSNLWLAATGHHAGEVVRRAGRCLVVQDLHGVHSGANPASGDFSVGVTGRVYEDGTPGAPVKGVTVALPIPDILRGVQSVADDRRWLPFGGSYGGATTLIAEMTVAGD